MSDLVDLERFESAKAEVEPFPFLLVDKFLLPTGLDKIIRDFPAIEEPRNHRLAGLEYGPYFARLLDELAQPEWARMLGEKLGVPDLENFKRDTSIRGHCEASDGNIHTDHPSKVVTALLYFNQEWSAHGGRIRILRSGTDLDDYAAEAPPIAGTLLAFRRTPRSFHGHHQFVGPRKMMQISWLSHNLFGRGWQGISRYGTHLAKRMGIHPDA